MADNIDMSNGRANIAYTGSRKDVWHRMGQEMAEGMDTTAWAQAAGLDWQAIKVPAVASTDSHGMVNVDGQRFIVRSDTGRPLGYVSDRYQVVQPAEVLDWFQQYISVDPNFKLDVAGSLKSGEIIWATATYNGGMKAGGDAHVARLLMTTTFDGSGATINQGTMTRVVCHNTLNVALSDKRAMVRTRHSTKFDAAKTGRELAAIAKGFHAYQAMGDAMGKTHVARDDVSKLFKSLLDIPFDTPKADISTRKLNQFEALTSAYRSTVMEGTAPETAWTALNAVTRYVDHDRPTRGGNGEMEQRFLSSQFGSGAALKAKAATLLMTEYVSDSELLSAASAQTDLNINDRDLLRAAFAATYQA